MRLGNLVIKEFRFVVLDFYRDAADLDFVLDDVGIYVERCDDGRGPAEPDLVSLNLWSRGRPLDEDARSLAGHDDVLGNDDVIFRLLINHNSSRVEMGERAFVDRRITLKGQYTSCVRVLQSVTFEVTVEDLDTCVGHRDDARDLLVGLPSAAVK